MIEKEKNTLKLEFEYLQTYTVKFKLNHSKDFNLLPCLGFVYRYCFKPSLENEITGENKGVLITVIFFREGWDIVL